ncbi:hypothetical protein JCM5353_001670 [Sporobolomyces roseus]
MSSAPRIVCRAGPSLSQLEPVPVNSSSIHIESSLFEGNVFVRLKDYKGPVGEDGKSQPEQAFSGEKDTWSIAFEGKFKSGKEEDGLEVDEILFGNTWEKPIKDYLPYGTSAALRFVKYVDPTLSCDLYSDKPWALSPLFSTFQYLSVSDSSSVPSSFNPSPMPENTSLLVPSDPTLVDTPTKRRSHFAQESSRKSTHLSSSHLVRGDFSHGFLDFSTLALSLPGGLSFSLAKYWNGEPVVFNCRKRSTGESFFVVTFELQDEEGGRLGSVKGDKGYEKEKKETEEEVKISDDVD